MTGDPTDEWIGDDRFAHHVADELQVAAAEAVPEAPIYDPATERPGAGMQAHKHYRQGQERRLKVFTAIQQGASVYEACDIAGVKHSTYKDWRRKYPDFAAQVDVARQYASEISVGVLEPVTPARFMSRYFGQPPEWFQLLFLQEISKVPLGNILMVLWPPSHGKTTTFENHANQKLAEVPGYRFLVASAKRDIAQKILGRVMNRMNPMGPTPEYVKDFGPFIPQSGGGMAQIRQPWTDTRFRVYKARKTDQRNYSMEAVGAKGSIVSARCEHLHIDDIQDTKTLSQTDSIANWIRQDAWSRPAEEGITTIVGTRVGDGDVYESFLEDEGLEDIMKVIRFPAVITDNTTGEQKPLWEFKGQYDAEGKPLGHTLETLDRARRKYGQEIWDRNWMQNPGVSRKGKGTFTADTVERCQDEQRSLEHHVGDNGDRASQVVFIGVDPALGGKNCVMACEATHNGQLIVRRIVEDIGFERNEQIMASIESVVRWSNMTGMVTDVVIEDKNFQLGLKNDERMVEMADKYGFNIRGHLTGWNKYDPDIGVASMSTSFIKREIVLPWADDTMTRHEIGELKRQLYAWKPGARGSKLRQDRVMALWFIWMLWQSRRKSIEGLSNSNEASFRRSTVGWRATPQGLIVPNRGAA